MMKRRNIIMVMMTSLLLGSCSSEDILSVPNGNGRIRFDVGVSQSQEVAVTPMNGGATRSAEPLFLPTSSIEMHSGDMKMYANCASTADIPMHNIIPETTTRGSIQTSDTFYSNFGIFGYFYDSNLSWASNSSSISPEPSMTNLLVTRNDNSWTTDVYWPGGTKEATFFAYAPHHCQGAILESNTGAPKITYTVPSVIDEQQDLLIAKSTEDISCDGNSTVALDFKHALAAIKFVKGDTPGYKEIKGIQISGVNNRGTLNMNSQSWESTSGSATYSISTIDENTVCFLMPQSVPSGAKLSVTLTNGGTEHTFEADLDGTTWVAGHQYTYELSINKVTGKFYFEVTANKPSVAKENDNISFTVKSYFKYDNSTTEEPITWQAKNSEGTVVLSGNGGSTETITESISIAPNIASSNAHKTNLQSVQIGTPTDYHDLSYDYDSNARWTANCYVVNGWGYFKLPLVYGNAIKNGTTNANAYTANTTSPNSANDFCNRNGAAISNPMITALSGTINKATIEWQYVNNLSNTTMVKNANVASESDGYTYLYFEIDKNEIDQGNALISVSDNGGILWSWHIWVTDMPWKTTYTYTDGKHAYSFMKMPLGMVDINTTPSGSTPRIVNYSFSQTPSNGNSVVVSINQAGDSYPTNTTCTFYQWGRKDPFKPTSYTPSTGGQTYATAIQNPTKFYKGESYDWSSGHSYQLWNAENTSASSPVYTSTKTIYDPCPPGFKVAPQYAYKIMNDYCGGFNRDSSASGRKCFNTSDFWRAFGYLEYSSGSLASAGEYGGYWSAGPYSVDYVYRLCFYSDNAYPTGNGSRANGFSVRPVSE